MSDKLPPGIDEEFEENKLIAQRRAKLVRMRKLGNAYPNDFRRDALAADLLREYGTQDAEALAAQPRQVCIAGRMMTRRVMGKASFAHLQDQSGQIQIFISQNAVGEEKYADFQQLTDLGDIIGATGVIFRTKTGELSIRCENIRLLTKTLRPLPEKFHGLTKTEARYRQRYLDLIVNAETREVFQTRTAIITFIRNYFNTHGYLEVETPMMHPIPGGATAQPFITYHNALAAKFYLRIAPELYLKRLVIGGFEKVYEINRNFRNEGVSTRHNPEFTMLEFYEAYADYRDLMNLTEDLLKQLAQQVLKKSQISYQGTIIDFERPFTRFTMQEALLRFYSGLKQADLDNLEQLQEIAKRAGITCEDEWGEGRIQFELFEQEVEDKLLEPTFITHYPTEVSPLARRNEQNPMVTDRFELFIGGREIANGFSELNDPEEQADRFCHQVAQKQPDNAEKLYFDSDYIEALEHGLPPTAGEGIGIDRLTMLFTDSPAIRDVLLFPHLRRFGAV